MNYRYTYNVYSTEFPQGRTFETEMDAKRAAALSNGARITISRTDRNMSKTEMLLSVYQILGGFEV